MLSAAIIVSEAGEGESGTDGIYSGRALVAECGKLLCEKDAFDVATLTAVCDVERCALESVRTGSSADADTASYEYVGFELPLSECETPKLGKSPFIPECDREFLHRAEEILTIQSRSLANRIKRSYSKGAVLGLSGGLDSTLALLVTVRAMDILGLDSIADYFREVSNTVRTFNVILIFCCVLLIISTGILLLLKNSI